MPFPAQALHGWPTTCGQSCLSLPQLQPDTLLGADAATPATRRVGKVVAFPTPSPPVGAGGLACAHAVRVCQSSPSATKAGPFAYVSLRVRFACAEAFSKPRTQHPATAPFNGIVSALSVATRTRALPKTGGRPHPKLSENRLFTRTCAAGKSALFPFKVTHPHNVWVI